jgi:spore maturation protein A
MSGRSKLLNYLWAGMIFTGILWGAVHGNLGAVTDGALEAAKDAVGLSITMLGVISMWTGVLEIGRRAGLIDRLSKCLKPFLAFLFPELPPEGEAAKHISVNFIANVLGLGWAATPAGLDAMKALKGLEAERRKQGSPRSVSEDTANREMCTFLILNISSLQLIPVNMIAYRSQYGSMAPAAIVGPAIAATALSTAAAVVFCKIMDKRNG